MSKTLLEIYISKSVFRSHVNKVIHLLDPQKKFIDDVIQDFCFYYACRPDRTPNIRKLYNLMKTKLRYEKRYVMVDYDELDRDVYETIEDSFIKL